MIYIAKAVNSDWAEIRAQYCASLADVVFK